MGPFCITVSAMLKPEEWKTELARLQSEAEKVNEADLKRLGEAIENAQKNYGESEQKDALMAKAEYLCRIGDKVGIAGGLVDLACVSEGLCVYVCVYVCV